MKRLKFEQMEQLNGGGAWGCIGGILSTASCVVGAVASAPTVAGAVAFIVGFK